MVRTGSEAEFKCDQVLLAMGFVHPVHAGMLETLKAEVGLELDPRGNVEATTEGSGAYQTSVPGVFAAGECVAVSPWWSGPSARAASAPGLWMSGSWGAPTCPAEYAR